ncbi:hypothetical protein DEU56DRAFT_903007 [Suillus clintonianus]|uniref:uncharacterized protein n=1 Tax=Suillus clintonianus TaxID=1904413 RepID=UPI001B860FE2|nr:uncharacterized protein DEU56DRAFT_903007 [Suillus clintonianus]KAG2129024.1 hypothetical protein DEU56DRAFT_903007 [Suillus clintonianus]
MDHYATQMSQSSIPGPSQDEPQPQPQRAEPVPFDIYADPSQYAPPGPAPTAHGMETAVVDAGMGQYGQPPLMPDMTGHVAVPPFAAHFPQPQMAPGPLYYHPPFAPYFPQPQMAPEPLYNPFIPPPFVPCFPQPQMAPGPLHDPSIPPPNVPCFPQPQMAPGPLHDPSIPPPNVPCFPQPQMAPGPLHDPSIPPPNVPCFPQPQMAPGPLHDPSIPPFQPFFPQVIPGPLYNPFIPPPFVPYFPQPQMMPGPSHHPSAPLPFGYLPQLSEISGAGRKTLTVPPNVQLIVQHGIIRYKCLLPQCKKWGTMPRPSMLKHITSKMHTGDDGQFKCEYCDKDLSRSDSLNRHYKSCSKRPKGPGDST